MSNTQLLKEIKQKLSEYKALLKSENFPVKKMILYGSFTKGGFKPYSDIDICVISNKFSKNKDKHETYLWKKALEVDARIEPVAYSPEDFNSIDPLVYEIKKFGVAV